MRLLLAEDERELSNALTAILKHNHYSVDAVYDGADALDYGLSENYDGIILDIMMPKLDRILGLDSGADDYLAKPFAMGELLARIRAMTRRRSEFSPDIVNYADISLDKAAFQLTGPKTSFRLGNKEFQMLEMLMSAPRRLISTEEFMERVWGYDSQTEINVVWVYISYLRKKLAALGAHVQIRAVRGVGYQLEETAK